MPLSLAAKRWVSSAAVLSAVIALGILSRADPIGWFWYDKSLGDVLYAMAAYFGLAFLLPRVPVGTIAALGAGACLAVEFLQLTEINASLLRVPVLRWFLGTTFLWHDIVCYLLGIAVAVALEVCFLRQPPLGEGREGEQISPFHPAWNTAKSLR